MEEAGQKLKRARERLNLRYRDVEVFSQRIAERQNNNDEYAIPLSRLADIENKGTVPSIYRIYTLCAIYRLDFMEVLGWYGVNLSALPADSAQVEIQKTHAVGFQPNGHGEVQFPLAVDPSIDFRKTTYLSRLIQRWGTVPLLLLEGAETKTKAHRYAFIGSDDWTMYPLIMPGSLVIVDETKKKIASSGWTSEFDRPIYLLEHRDGWSFGWCSIQDGKVTLMPHPSASVPPLSFDSSQVEVVGQITGAAMQLDRRRTRT
jgi:hypothetical protein